METKKNGLTKKERISGKKEIDFLFGKGNSFIAYPLRVVYIERDCDKISGEPVASIMISVSKKKFRRAVKRNRLKRLIKESYRLNKSRLIENLKNQGKFISIAFLYLSNEEKTYAEIETAVQKALEILPTKI